MYGSTFLRTVQSKRRGSACRLLMLGVFLIVARAIGAQVTADAPLDFDGDGRTDYCTTRVEGDSLIWYVQPSNGAPHYAVSWGLSGDVALPEDFDGDGRDDLAVWRPASPSATFYILQSETNTLRAVPFGLLGDDPSMVRDYDGDNRADPAVYRNGAPGSQSFFYFLGSQNNPNNAVTYVPWGIGGDFPIAGDFDGDGRGDFAVQRNVNNRGLFYLLQSSSGFSTVWFGLPTDLVAAGDYDGDQRTDLCVIRPDAKNLRWWIRRSSDGSIASTPFGLSNLDLATPGDYNGDGQTDVAVWRPNPDPAMCFFYVNQSGSGTTVKFEWGIGSDFPAANFNVR